MSLFYNLVHCIQAVAAMVEECCKFVEQTPDRETKIKLIDTLRTVSEGKVHKSLLSTVISAYHIAGNVHGVKFSWMGDLQRFCGLFCGWTFPSYSTHITRLAPTPQFQPAENFRNVTRVAYNQGYNLR